MADLRGQQLKDSYQDVVTRGAGNKLENGNGVEFADLDDKASLLSSKISVSVGSGGDFPTINDALRDLTKRMQTYITGQGVIAEINLLSGFVMAEQVIVEGDDFSWIEITSEDAQVTIDRSAITEEVEAVGNTNRKAVFCARGSGHLPIIGCLFYMDNSGDSNVDFCFCVDGGRAHIRPDCGCDNAGAHAFYALSGSYQYLRGAIATNSGLYAVRGAHASWQQARSVNGDGAKSRGFLTGAASVQDNRGSTCNDCEGDWAYRSSNGGFQCNDITSANNCAGIAYVCEEGAIQQNANSTANNCSDAAFDCRNAGVQNNMNTEAKNCGGNYAYRITNSGSQNNRDADCSNSSNGATYADNAATQNNRDMVANDMGAGIIVFVGSSSVVNARGFIQNGGEFSVTRGSSMYVSGPSENQLSQSPNTITSDGIIFFET